MRIFINYKRNAEPDHPFAEHLEKALKEEANQVFRDESGVEPSQVWTQRIEDELRACTVFISLVSNASMASTWVLNELDFAIRLKKRIIPVMLGVLDESIEFQHFRPRLMLVQFYRATGDFSADSRQILELIHAQPKLLYQSEIEAVLRASGVSDPVEVLCGLLWLLRDLHRQAIGFGTSSVFFDGLDGLTGRHALSLADSLRNIAFPMSSMHTHNAQVAKDNGKEAEAASIALAGSRMKCMAEIIDKVIGAWEAEGKQTLMNVKNLMQKLKKDRNFTPLADIKGE